MTKPTYMDSVFINCPFDQKYQPIFDAIVFAICDCGFSLQCAREEKDNLTCRDYVWFINEGLTVNAP